MIQTRFPKYPYKDISIDKILARSHSYQSSYIPSDVPVKLGDTVVPELTIPSPKEVPLKSLPKQIPFWIHDPKELFQTFDLISHDAMSLAERLNAMTRVIIILTAIMFAVRFPLWWLFLVLGLLVVIAMWYLIKGQEDAYLQHRHREYLRRPIVQVHKTIIQECPTVHNQKLNIISVP